MTRNEWFSARAEEPSADWGATSVCGAHWVHLARVQVLEYNTVCEEDSACMCATSDWAKCFTD
jgi:hypothetical protein